MSLRRQKDDLFDATPPDVAAAVRVVLSRRPPHAHTTETRRDASFSANIRPGWWLLGTDLTLEIEPSPDGTRVFATTTSQWFILGDVFNCYNRYLSDFFRDVRSELQNRRMKKPAA